MEGSAAVWSVVDVDESSRAARAAKHRLTDATRRLIDAVALVDGADATDELDALTALVDQATRAVGARPSLASSGLASSPGPDRVIAERSPVAGRSNPLAPPVSISVERDRATATVQFGSAYEGPAGAVHGGIVAAVFDTLFGVAHRLSGSAGFTGRLEVTYRRPTPLGRLISYEGGVTEASGHKIHCWGRSTCDGELLAEADCTFVVPRPTAPIKPG